MMKLGVKGCVGPPSAGHRHRPAGEGDPRNQLTGTGLLQALAVHPADAADCGGVVVVGQQGGSYRRVAVDQERHGQQCSAAAGSRQSCPRCGHGPGGSGPPDVAAPATCAVVAMPVGFGHGTSWRVDVACMWMCEHVLAPPCRWMELGCQTLLAGGGKQKGPHGCVDAAPAGRPLRGSWGPISTPPTRFHLGPTANCVLRQHPANGIEGSPPRWQKRWRGQPASWRGTEMARQRRGGQRRRRGMDSRAARALTMQAGG